MTESARPSEGITSQVSAAKAEAGGVGPMSQPSENEPYRVSANRRVTTSAEMPSPRHERVYDAARVIRYESRCTCGATFVRETDIDARAALRAHMEGR